MVVVDKQLLSRLLEGCFDCYEYVELAGTLGEDIFWEPSEDVEILGSFYFLWHVDFGFTLMNVLNVNGGRIF